MTDGQGAGGRVVNETGAVVGHLLDKERRRTGDAPASGRNRTSSPETDGMSTSSRSRQQTFGCPTEVQSRVVYKIRTGISWRDLPERYGPWQTVYTRFRRYALDGVFT
ncbi:hypothetical protein GCM10027073_44170 [Streptomyces chlorus]|uniref:Transposase n=1 Tax=Streptomyces chlorus TaxID=887452 RepID=A0ABW1DZJ3_9ACTN